MCQHFKDCLPRTGTPMLEGMFALARVGGRYVFSYFRMITGITQKTNRNHIVRAALEGVCLRTYEVR